MVIEIHKTALSEHWISGESLDVINDWRDGFLMTHNSITHYIGSTKPMIVFPITYIPNNEEGVLFDRIYIVDAIDSVVHISTGVIFVNKEFVSKCIPCGGNPKDFLFNKKANFTPGFLDNCVNKHGAMLIGVSLENRGGVINEELESG